MAKMTPKQRMWPYLLGLAIVVVGIAGGTLLANALDVGGARRILLSMGATFVVSWVAVGWLIVRGRRARASKSFNEVRTDGSGNGR